MTQRDPDIRLRHMRDHGQEALDLIRALDDASFRQDRVLQLAVVHLLEIVGEAATTAMATVIVRAKLPADEAWVRARLAERWGTTIVACVSGLHDAALLDGLVAELDGEPVGLLNYRIENGECEAVTVDSYSSTGGVGKALLQAVADLARARGCRRAWLTTTNDNLPALRFYQRRGWDLIRLHYDAVNEWRRTVKPGIPERGLDGIPLAHALELELRL